MTISVEWADERRRILVKSIGYDWTWEDWRQATDEVFALAQESAPGLALVCSVPGDISLPPGGFTETIRRSLDCHAEVQLRAVIYAMRNPALRLLWQELIERHASPTVEYRFVDTMDAAFDLAESAV